MVHAFFVLFLIAQAETNAPIQYSGKSVKMLASLRLENAAFHIYDPPFKAKSIYKSMEDAKCKTPEELVMSIQSEETQEWVNYNWLGGKGQIVAKQQFEKRKMRDTSTNFFELVHKLTFLYNGVNTVIIKFWFVDDNKRTILSSMVLQEKEGRWYRTNIAGLDHLNTVIMRLKSDYLTTFLNLMPPDAIAQKKESDTENLKKKIKDKVLGEQGVLDTERLYNEIMQLRMTGKTNELFQFIDKSDG